MNLEFEADEQQNQCQCNEILSYYFFSGSTALILLVIYIYHID